MRGLLETAVWVAAIGASACTRGGPAASRPAPVGEAAEAPPPALATVVDSVVSTPPLDRTHWGILIVDAASGRTLAAVNPEKHFIPASNTKLVVTAVAMGLLGPEWRYATPVYALSREGAAPGTARALVIAGRGDPTWSRRFHGSDAAVLEALADSVAAAGIRRIDGPLIVDASYFDDERIHSAWEVGDLVWSYATPVAAVAIGEGTVRVVVRPGAAADAGAVVEVDAPDGRVPVRNEVITTGSGVATDLDIERGPWSDTLRISGTIAVDAKPDTSRLAVTDPAGFAGRTFERILERRGIEVTGGVRVVHDPVLAGALAPRDSAGVIRVAAWSSAPVREIIGAILKPSQNWIAEQLLKTLGATHGERGSWREGVRVERRYLIDRAGVDSAAFSLVDASGLSAQNLLSPDAIVQILRHADGSAWAAQYRAALAEPQRQGTLTARLAELEGRVAAKTGTISNVNGLSGYLRADDGRDLYFSILTNATGRPPTGVRAAMDRIVRAAAAP